ncbi:hypothetical protein HYX12_01290 [Candidatus Woesearchaeota archaeon]|nr:hypothetical protein [Candidatus Woesearchaeota archaeon]
MQLSGERTEHGFKDYFLACYKAAKQAKASFNLRCKVDGKAYYLKNCVTLNLAKIPFFGYGFRSIIGHVDPGDGKVYSLAVVNKHSSFFNKGLRLWALLLARMNLEKAPLVSFKGKRFVVDSKELFPLQAGGEFLGYTKKVAVKVIRQQKVLVV